MTAPVEYRLEIGDDVPQLALKMRQVFGAMTTPELKRLKRFLESNCTRARPDADYAIRVLAAIGMAYTSAVFEAQSKHLAAQQKALPPLEVR